MTSPFRTLGLAPSLAEVVEELGFAELTPIQARSLPPLLEGRDLVGRSPTGSGKTAAYLLPMLQRIDVSTRRLQGLVLCPTRELCAQVAREARTLGRKLAGLQVLIVAGGQPARPQVEALHRGVHLVVGTPGRVRDLLLRGLVVLDPHGMVVLDEADRMLDMGFEHDMRTILKAMPGERRTAFFSATFPNAIGAMSARFQRDPIHVSVGEEASVEPDIRHVMHAVEHAERPTALRRVLAHHPYRAAIVFCDRKATAAELGRALRADGLAAEALHGDLEQAERDRVMAKFRNGSTRVLVATDVAARGLDVADVDLVVNYDLPPQAEVYVHRVGRTGRAGRAGAAVSFAGTHDAAKWKVLAETFGIAPERMALPEPPEGARGAASVPATAPAPIAMKTLYVTGGRKEKVRPGDLLGALTGEAAGLAAEDVGRIEIHDHFAYVAVAERVAERALQGLRDGRIKGRRFRVGFVD